MPNAIKYKAGNLTGSLQKGNVALGISGSLGPTSTTGWYNGPNPVAGKYQIFETAISGDPEVYSPQDDAELIKFARWKGATGANTGSAAAVLAWIGTQTNLMAANFEYPNIVTDGLVLNLDAGFVGSYPTTASTCYDLSGYSNNGTLINGVTFNTSGGGCFRLDGVDDRIDVPKTLNGFTYNIQYDINWTLECWMYMYTPDATPQTYKQIYGNYNGCNYDALKGNAAGFFLYSANEPSNISSNFTFGPRNNPGGSQCPGVVVGWNNSETAWVYASAVNKWCNWVMTSDDGTYYKIYVNGVQQGSTKTVDFKNSQTRIDNNLTATTDYSWGGNIIGYNQVDFAAMRIYNKPLSQAEVTQNYNAQKGRFGL